MPKRPALPCGLWFCPVPLRILYPDPAFRVTDIAALYGTGLSEVERRAHKLGLFALRPHRTVPRYSRTAFAAMWRDPSLTVREIAGIMGLGKHTVSMHARRLGLGPRRGGAASVTFGPGFAALWNSGLRTADMARHYGCHPDTVLREALRQGLPRRVRLQKRPRLANLAEWALARALAEDAARTRAALKRRDMVGIVAGRPRPKVAA